MNETITRDAARAAGLTYYNPSAPCKQGHMTERYVNTGQCVTCQRARSAAQPRAYKAAWRATHQDEIKAYAIRYYKTHKKARRAYQAAYRAAHAEQVRASKAAYRARQRAERAEARAA